MSQRIKLRKILRISDELEISICIEMQVWNESHFQNMVTRYTSDIHIKFTREWNRNSLEKNYSNSDTETRR